MSISSTNHKCYRL